MRAVIHASLVYFGLVFTAGFTLGILRALLVVPLIGERLAECAEIPLMVVVSYFAARFVLDRFVISSLRGACIIGAIALALLLIVEISVVLNIRGLPLDEYAGSRDPIAFTAYLIGLAVFAGLPLALQLSQNRSQGV